MKGAASFVSMKARLICLFERDENRDPSISIFSDTQNGQYPFSDSAGAKRDHLH